MDHQQHQQGQEQPLDDNAKKFIVRHMNKDHKAHMILYCTYLQDYKSADHDVDEVTDAEMISVDNTGFDILAKLKRTTGSFSEATFRFSFPKEIKAKKEVREHMVALAAQAQKKKEEAATQGN